MLRRGLGHHGSAAHRPRPALARRAGIRAAKARNIIWDHALLLQVTPQGAREDQGIEGSMATRQHRQIVETPTEAHQAEPCPSVLALLAVSTGLAILILGVVWFVFFRT